MPAHVSIDQAKLEDFCRRWNVVELALFGSVLRDDFGPRSDVDVLVLFKPDADIGLSTYEDMALELAAMFNRPVDLVPKKWLKPHIRDEVLNSAMVVYAA